MADTEELERMMEEAQQKARESHEDFINDTPTFFKRVKERLGLIRAWINRPIRILDVVVFIVIIAILISLNINKETSSFNAAIEKPIISTLNPIKEKKVEVIVSKKGIIQVDLTKYENTKFELRTLKDKDGKDTDVKRFRSFYRKSPKVGAKIYITIEENVDAIKYNKVAYTKYLELNK